MNKKLFNLVLAVVVALGIGQASQAITSTFKYEYNGALHDEYNGAVIELPGKVYNPPYGWDYLTAPNVYIPLGTFIYSIPVGDHIVSAKVYGKWGNIDCVSTAHNMLYLGGMETGMLVADTTDPQYHDPTDNDKVTKTGAEALQTPWLYDFDIDLDDLSILYTGNVSFGAYQNGDGILRLGPTTLEIVTEQTPPPTPEPSSMILGFIGLGSALGFKRKKSA